MFSNFATLKCICHMDDMIYWMGNSAIKLYNIQTSMGSEINSLLNINTF